MLRLFVSKRLNLPSGASRTRGRRSANRCQAAEGNPAHAQAPGAADGGTIFDASVLPKAAERVPMWGAVLNGVCCTDVLHVKS